MQRDERESREKSMGAVCGRPFYYPLLIQLSHSHSQSLPVPPSPSLSPSLQVSGANYAGTFEVTRARGTYPTSLSATLPPARYGTVRCSAAQVWSGRQGPAQPSPAVLPGPSLSLPLFLACVKVSPVCHPVSQAGSQSISRSACRPVIHSFAQSHPPPPARQAVEPVGPV